MKRFVDFLGKLVAGILVTAFIFAAVIFFLRDSFVLSSYSPPDEPQMYFSTDPNAEDQYVLVKLNPDSSLELIRALTDKESYYADDLPPVIVPNPMLGIPIWGGVSLAPLDCIVPLGGVAVKGGAAVPLTLDGQAAERYPPSKRRKG